MEKDKLYFEHILEAIRKVQRYIAGMSYEDFAKSELTQDAVIRQLEIIGEAARAVSQEVKLQYPAIAWVQISAMRNKLIHEYFGVDTEIVWKTINEDLLDLFKKFKGITLA